MVLAKSPKFTVAFSLKKRIVWFSGEVNARSARKVISALKKLNKTRGPICFYLSGVGGDFKYCFMMGKEIQNSPNQIIGVAHGQVISACFMLTQFFKVCVGVQGATFVFHRAVRESRITRDLMMSQDFLQRELDRLRMVDAIQVALFYRRLNDFDRLFELLRSEKVLGLDEVIKLRLLDDHFNTKEFWADRRLMRAILKKG